MPALDEHSPALDIAQGGFRPQRSPLDQALCLHDLMRDYFVVHRHRPVVAFLDIKSAYDTVDRRVIWSALAGSSIPRAVLGLLINLFDDVSVSVLIANHNSAAFSPTAGVLQGSVLSPHLYSLYINSLPSLLRSDASSAHGASGPIAINSLLFADDVAVFGSKAELEPSKCAVLGSPATLADARLTLYNESLPFMDEFVYLGMPFRYQGLSARDFTNLDALQNRLVGMFVSGFWFHVAKHITCLPSMKHRYNVLATRYALRSTLLPEDSLVVVLRGALSYTRLDRFICESPLYTSLPAVVPSSAALRTIFSDFWQDQVDQQLTAAAATGCHTLLRACRPDTTRPDPILYLPLGRTARSRLIRWRLGRFTNMREECPCMDGSFISRDHFPFCRALPSDLWDALPAAPPGVHAIDNALNLLPLRGSAGPPVYWSALLSLLHAIDCLVHPLATIAPDPDPGSLWFCPPTRS